jgi:hypothetical protein
MKGRRRTKVITGENTIDEISHYRYLRSDTECAEKNAGI